MVLTSGGGSSSAPAAAAAARRAARRRARCARARFAPTKRGKMASSAVWQVLTLRTNPNIILCSLGSFMHLSILGTIMT